MKATLLNIRNFHSDKKNKDYTVIQYLRPLTPSEVKERGYIGATISEEVFVPEFQINTLTSKDIDHDIELQYDIIGGRAVLGNIVVH